MNNVLLEIMYNGFNYSGFQMQNNAVTISFTIKNAILKLVNEDIIVRGCSRTDSKVHANQYFLTFKTTKNIKEENIKRALNSFLPNDISVINARYVNDDFHPQYDAIKKEYIYKIYNTMHKNPFLYGLAHHYKRDIDLCIINSFCEKIIGTHDFLGFSKRNDDIKNTVRTIYSCELKEVFHNNYVFSITGNGFLYNMVRIIVGTALSLNEGSLSLNDVDRIFIEKNRKLAGRTAPAYGLYLNKVEY